jgi:type IV secretory pathway VirB4 component
MARTTLHTRELIPIDRIQDGIIVLSNGGLRRIALVSGINFELRSEEEQEAIIAGYQGFLNALDFDLQIFIHSRKVNIESYLKEIDGIAARERANPLGALVAEYRAFVEGLVAQNPIMEKRFFVVIPFDPVTPSSIIAQLFPRGARKGAAASTSPAPLAETAVAALNHRTDEVIAGLAQIGLRAAPLNTEEATELLYNLYNPHTIGRHLTYDQEH